MRLERSSVPPIYALTAPLPGHTPVAVASRLLDAGIRWLQFREKQADDLATLDAARSVSAAHPASTIFINDRVDLAIASGAAGVHLGDRDLPAIDARSIAGTRLLIGVSTHSVEQALAAAVNEAVDYIAIGPIFHSPTKNVRTPLGLDTLRAIRARTAKPLVAIGGIGLTNLAAVLAAGADSVALISALYENGAIEENVARLQQAAGRR